MRTTEKEKSLVGPVILFILSALWWLPLTFLRFARCLRGHGSGIRC